MGKSGTTQPYFSHNNLNMYIAGSNFEYAYEVSTYMYKPLGLRCIFACMSHSTITSPFNLYTGARNLITCISWKRHIKHSIS